MSQPATSDYTGRQIGSWRLERLLGVGSFGSVYLAKNPVIDREAAVKILHSHFTVDPQIRRRFFDEARAASKARLTEDDNHPHPGVVQIFDGDDGSGSSGGLCYIVMERLHGTTLQEALAGGPLPPLDTAQLGAALADTLAAVHRRGVIHRDLKPENIFLQQGDPRRPKILDLGIAKLREGGQARCRARSWALRCTCPRSRARGCRTSMSTPTCTALGIGVALAGTGAALLAIDGTGGADCWLPSDSTTCKSVLKTQAGGAALVGVGGAALVGAVVLFTLDARRHPRHASVAITAPAGRGGWSWLPPQLQ